MLESLQTTFSVLLENSLSLVFVSDFGHRLHWIYLLFFFAVGSVLYMLRKPKDLTIFSFLVPKNVFISKSFFTDVKIYVINGLIGSSYNIATIVLSVGLISMATKNMLGMLTGTEHLQYPSSSTIDIAYSIGFLLLTDLALFIAHYLHHKVPFLWNFHKTHHSAEVLTPVTAFRFHPFETIFIGMVLALLVGPLIGVYEFLYDSSLFLKTPVLFGAAMLIWLLNANFRHSHIPFHYPKFLSKYIVSPVMHNVHHSANPIHFDKNMGFMFSFWDRVTGTYYLPKRDETLAFGLSEKENKIFSTAYGCYMEPLKANFRLLKKYFR